MISQTIHVPKQSQCSYQGYHCRVGAAVPQYIPDRAVSGETAQTRYLAGHLAQSVVSHRRITAALRSYCNSVHYFKVSTKGAVRVDLAGEPAGNVTAKEAEFVQRRLIAKKAAAGKPTSTGERKLRLRLA
jgi:hypothetical protein